MSVKIRHLGKSLVRASLGLGLVLALSLSACKQDTRFQPLAAAELGPVLPAELSISDLPPPALAYGRFICAERQACRYAVVPSKVIPRQRVIILTAPGQILEQGFALSQILSKAQTEVWILELPGLGDVRSLNPSLDKILRTEPQPSLSADLRPWALAVKTLLAHAMTDSPDLPTLILSPESVSTALLAYGVSDKAQLMLVYPDPDVGTENSIFEAYHGANPNLGRGTGLEDLKARLEKTRLDILLGGDVFSAYPPIFYVTQIPQTADLPPADEPPAVTAEKPGPRPCPLRAQCSPLPVAYGGKTTYLTDDYMIVTLIEALKKRPDIAAQALLDLRPPVAADTKASAALDAKPE